MSDLTELDRMISKVSTQVARVLNLALNGKDITVPQALTLFNSVGLDLNATVLVADQLRRQTVGDLVTYVVNRNINFTNVCIKRCGFCAFSRDYREDEGYMLPLKEIVRRAKEAWELGATEVCIQAGLPPQMEGHFYVELCAAIKKELPEIHIHGFSPEEVLYGSIRSKSSIRTYLQLLKDAGVGSLPGTSAEILDQKLRDKISPGRITVDKWLEVIKTAHELNIPTTSTIMYGHVETFEHQARHISLIRDVQMETNGITEFVPLSFVNQEAPMFFRKSVEGLRPGASGMEVLKIHAISRIMLNNWIPNIQVSWVKEGPRLSEILLQAGVNDLGGSLINESISTAAGASHGQLIRPSEFRQIIRGVGRKPAERYTSYKIRRIFEANDDPIDPLDQLPESPEKYFGTYDQLIKLKTYRYKHPKINQENSSSLND